MDIRTIDGRKGVADHSGTATAWYMVERDEMQADTEATHLEYVVEFKVTAGRQLEFHYHNNFEFFYVLEGTGTMMIEGEEAPVGPGSLIKIGPNEVHSLRPDGTQDLHVFCFGLNLSKDSSEYHAAPDPKEVTTDA